MTTTFIYKKVNQVEIKAELFPTLSKKAPLIIYIHGGGLIWGTRKDINTEQVKLYNEKGYNVLSIAYRLAPETKLSEIVKDIQDAMTWVENEATHHFDFDPNKKIVVGSSAGGYLALLTGTFSKNRPQAIVSFYGYGSILGDWYQSPSSYFNQMPKVNEPLMKQLIQKNELAEAPITQRYAIYLYCRQQGVWLDHVADRHSTEEEHLQKYCPIYHIDSNYPPTLLLHGNSDEDVPYDESKRMHQALLEKGVVSELFTMEDGKHQFDENMSDPNVQKAFDQIFHFLDKTVNR